MNIHEQFLLGFVYVPIRCLCL